MRKTVTLLILLSGLSLSFASVSCMARMNVNYHPDYNFAPTSPTTIRVYKQFLPAKRFIIIGQIRMTQLLLTDMKKSRQRLLEISASMGGNGIIMSGSRISWHSYNTAVTRGVVQIQNYGYKTYRGTYASRTVYRQRNIPVRRDYYIYVIRWMK